MSIKLPLAGLFCSEKRKELIVPMFEREQFEVSHFSSIEEFEHYKKKEDISFVIMEDSFGAGIWEFLAGFEMLQDFRKELRDGVKYVMILDDHANEGRALREKMDGYIKFPEPEKMIDELRNYKQKFSKDKIFKATGASLGIVGLGPLGLGIAEKVRSSDLFQNVYVYSRSAVAHASGRTYEELANLKGLECNSNEFTPCKSLEDLFEKNPDFLVISTGPSPDEKFDFVKNQNRSRKSFLEDFYERTMPHVRPIFEEIKRTEYSGLIITLSTPDDSLNLLGMEEYGINPEKLTTITPDNMRNRKLTFRELMNNYKDYVMNENLKRDEDIDSIVVGYHWKPIPLHQFTKIKGTPLSEFVKINPCQITDDLREYGIKVMKAHQLNRIDFEDSSLSVSQNLERIIYSQQHKLDPLGCYFHSGFVQLPAYVDLKKKIVRKTEMHPKFMNLMNDFFAQNEDEIGFIKESYFDKD